MKRQGYTIQTSESACAKGNPHVRAVKITRRTKSSRWAMRVEECVSPPTWSRVRRLEQSPPPSLHRRQSGMEQTGMEDTLSRFPDDVLVDSVLAACSPPSLAALGATCRRWHEFITGPPGEIIWQRRAARDFKFPVHSTGRRTGWYRLYSQLASSSALVWGVRLPASACKAPVCRSAEPTEALTAYLPSCRPTRTGGLASLPSDGTLQRGSRTISDGASSAVVSPYRPGSSYPIHRRPSSQADGPSTR